MGGLAVIALLLAVHPERVLVVTLSDAAPPEALQSAIERRVAADGWQTIGGAEAGAKIGVPEPLPSDPATREAADGLLSDAGKAYYDDRYEQMLDRLSKAEALKTTPAERIRIALWRVAVYLALNDSHGASDQARAALTLDPGLTVDLKIYPPSVHDAVERVRPTLTLLPVTITGLPAGATIHIDDREVPASTRVPAGSHRVAADAPGCRHVEAPLEVSGGGASLELRLPPSLPPAIGSPLLEDTWNGAADASLLDGLSAKTGADVVAVAVERQGRIRDVVWWRADGRRVVSALRNDDDAGRGEAADYVARELRRGRPSLRDRSLVVWSTAAIAAGYRHTTVKGAGTGYDTAVGGSGPRLTLAATRGVWSAMLSGESLDYGFSTIRVTGGASARETGGSELRGQLYAGGDLRLGQPGEDQRTRLGVRLGATLEQYRGFDPGGVGIVPRREQRFAPEVAVAGSFPAPYRGASDASVSVRVGLMPWERDRVSADLWGRPSYGFGLETDIAFAMHTQRRWQVGADVRWESNGLLFRGPSGIPTALPQRDLTVQEDIGSVSILAGRSF